MKIKINIICALLLGAITMSLVTTFVQEMPDFLLGWNEGFRDNVSSGFRTKYIDRYVNLYPEDVVAFKDSVYNSSTGEWIPLQYRTLVLRDTHVTCSKFAQAVDYYVFWLILIAYIVELTMLIKLIRAVNRSIIFDWSNVVRLRWIGASMLFSFICTSSLYYLDYLDDSANIKITGYHVNTLDLWDFYSLTLGLGLFLIAEVFAAGLRLKEEQDLTI